jgi:hypothetical protein
MNLRSAKRWSAGLLLFLLCTLASGLLAAQTSGNASASSLKPSAGSASPEAASSASKPHDSSFIIGNDDVLAPFPSAPMEKFRFHWWEKFKRRD